MNMAYPISRMRRLRISPAIRRLVRETDLDVSRLIYPIFVSETITGPEAVEAMPGIFRLPLREAVRKAVEVFSLGIGGIILFGIPARKDARGTEAANNDGIIQKAVREIKNASPEIPVITDVCLCEYTDHGHCGIIKDNNVDNDATVEILAEVALSHARSGADLVAPSDMMDGRVGTIRRALDANGFHGTGIMAYAAKYCSAFYGPFREAAGSAPTFGDRKTYQMDPANAREALREIRLDVEEGADIIMVKPALSYLDIIARARSEFDLPLAAYNVSGEYSMARMAAAAGLFDEKRIVLEILTSIRRAGADIIISYHAPDVAGWLE